MRHVPLGYAPLRRASILWILPCNRLWLARVGVFEICGGNITAPIQAHAERTITQTAHALIFIVLSFDGGDRKAAESHTRC